MKTLIFILAALLATACSVPQTPANLTIQESLAVGSVLRLNKAITFPQERSIIYIANGKVAPLKNYNTVNKYFPYCMLRLRKELKQSHTVVPGEFKITKITEWEGYYSYYYPADRGRKYLDGGLIKTGMNKINSERDGSDDIIMYATILRLHSDMQPDVRELVCGHWDMKSQVEPLTLDELKSALGDLMTIEAKVI